MSHLHNEQEVRGVQSVALKQLKTMKDFIPDLKKYLGFVPPFLSKTFTRIFNQITTTLLLNPSTVEDHTNPYEVF